MTRTGDSGASHRTRDKLYRRLARRYFASTCRSVLDPFLLQVGFREARSSTDQLIYRRGACFLAFGYFPYVTDEQPRYALTVAIGIHRGWLWKPRMIGLWQVPNPDRGGNRWQWEFRGPEQLRRGLKKVIGLLEAYAQPLWEDEGRLRAVIEREWPIYLELANP